MDYKAVVIGAGIAGIASAIRLRKKGYMVTVFEKNGYPGGKMTEIRDGGFRFDAGPSLFTLPELVDELFDLCGKNPRRYFTYKSLENSCLYFYPDGTKITAYNNRQRFAEELQQKTGEPVDNTLGFLDKCAELYDLTADVFIFSAFSIMSIINSKEAKRVAGNFRKLDTFRTMHAVVSDYFSDKRVVQLFDRYATYNGSNPYKVPGTLNVIPHLEHNTGAWFPEQGIHSITEALVKLADEEGVVFSYNSPVTSIDAVDGKVTGVKVCDNIYSADVVISDIDIASLYSSLIGKRLPLLYASGDRSSSALIFYWCIEDSFPQFDLHNIFFSSDYWHEFKMMERGDISDDPTIYLYISSKMVPSDAPDGCENWFVMINVPENRGQDWDELTARMRAVIICRLSRETNKDIGSLIRSESLLDPILIEEKTGSVQGSLYGNSSNSMFAAFRRHPNHRSNYKNVWFTGGSVHPGGGIPLCLASAKIATDQIDNV